MRFVLVCPTCRTAQRRWTIDLATRRCTNPRCRRGCALVPGTAIPTVTASEVLPEPFAGDLSSPDRVARWVAGLTPGSDDWEAAVRVGMYVMADTVGDSLADRLVDWFCEVVPTRPATALDLGCGTGGLVREIARRFDAAVLGVDNNPLALKFAANTGPDQVVPRLDAQGCLVCVPTNAPQPPASASLVCANALDPPLDPASFALVSAVNLLDVVDDPLTGLDRISSLVEPGGLLLLAQPDAYDVASIPPARRPATGDWPGLLEQRGFEVIAHIDPLPWRLERTARIRFEYDLWGLVARRAPDAPGV